MFWPNFPVSMPINKSLLLIISIPGILYALTRNIRIIKRK